MVGSGCTTQNETRNKEQDIVKCAKYEIPYICKDQVPYRYHKTTKFKVLGRKYKVVQEVPTSYDPRIIVML
jgi:hypothetical protein